MSTRATPASVRRRSTLSNVRVRRAVTDEPERDFQAAVVKLAKMLRWRVYHTWNSRHSAAGFPDLVMVRGPRQLVVELKRERGKVTTDQQDWLDAFGQVPGVEAYVWRPSQWKEVVSILRRVRG